MPQLNYSSAALRIFGEILQPEEITRFLACAPTMSWLKGHTFKTSAGHTVVRPTGAWILDAKKSEPENLNDQVSEILGKLTADISIWNSISQRFQLDLFCGLFMEKSSAWLLLSPATLLALAERKIQIDLSIYGPNEGEIADDELCPCDSGKKYGECCAPKSPADALRPVSSRDNFISPSAG
jgi:hypothetical protein